MRQVNENNCSQKGYRGTPSVHKAIFRVPGTRRPLSRTIKPTPNKGRFIRSQRYIFTIDAREATPLHIEKLLLLTFSDSAVSPEDHADRVEYSAPIGTVTGADAGSTPATETSALADQPVTPNIQQIAIGKSVRATCSSGSWCLFSFELPAAGPVLTVMLDAGSDRGAGKDDGKRPSTPELFVSRERVPGGVGDMGLGRGIVIPCSDWESPSSHEGLRLIKIFPRDRK